MKVIELAFAKSLEIWIRFRIKVALLNCPIFQCRIAAVLIKNALHKLLSVDYLSADNEHSLKRE